MANNQSALMWQISAAVNVQQYQSAMASAAIFNGAAISSMWPSSAIQPMAVAWRCNGGNGWLSQHPSISYIGINGEMALCGWLAGWRISSRSSMANGVSMAAGWLAGY
jgi:hypothetical protein